VERSFAHVCDSGGTRRSWLRGLGDVKKRYLIAAAAHNLGRVLRKLFGIGKPRSLQGGFGPAALVQMAIRAVARRLPEVGRTPEWLTRLTTPIAA
jgi:hypothetical protein